jgi:hypothetical protein
VCKRDGVTYQNAYNDTGSAEGRAQTACDARAKVGFRACRGNVHSAVNQAVDERPDDFGPINRFAVLAPDIGREPVEVDDLPIEEDDRNLRPGFLVDGRPAASDFGDQTDLVRLDPFPRR